MTPSYFNTHSYLKIIKTLIPPDEPNALAFRLEEKLGIPNGAIEIGYRGEYCTRASSLKGLRDKD